MRKKWLAALLSTVVPGLGQWYMKRRIAGVLFLLVALALVATGANEILSYVGNTRHGLVDLAVGFVIWGFSIFHAFLIGLRNDKSVGNVTTTGTKDPYLAVAFSYLFPGLGQFYVEDYLNAFVFLGLYVGAREFLSWLIKPYAIIVVAGFSSHFAARKIPKAVESDFRVVVSVIFLVYGISLFKSSCFTFVQKYFVTYTTADGPSMEPTIRSGDVLLIDVRAKDHLRRGDIVSCREPDGVRVDKRAVAFGGETVQINNGRIYVNGVELASPPFNSFRYVTDTSTVFGAHGEPYLVPPGCLYILGDNSENSYDSRYCGPIKTSDVLGVVYKIELPYSRAKFLIPEVSQNSLIHSQVFNK